MLNNYIKVALRNLVKNRVYSLINILGLSVAVACCMLIFLYGKDEVTFDQFLPNNKNIYRVTVEMVKPSGEKTLFGSTGMMPGPAFKRSVPEIQDFVRVQSANMTVKTDKDVFEQEAHWADQNLFSVFQFQFLHGRPENALNGLNSLVISEEIAEKYFGRSDVIGRSLQLTSGFRLQTFVVSAVIKNVPQNSSLRPKMILPMKNLQAYQDDKMWLNFFLNTFVVMKPESDIPSVEKKFEQIYNTEAKGDIKEMAEQYGFKETVHYHLQPLTAMHLSTELPADNGLDGSSNPIYSWILSSIAVFILIIACINFINLTLARSIKRAREIGVRKAVGGSRSQLIAQFLGESFLLSFFSFVLACVLTWLTLPFFNTLANKELSFSYLLDVRLVVGYIGLFFITGFLAGFYPALVLSRLRPVETLAGKFRFAGKDYLSRGLLVFQFTLSTFLMIATITVYSQLDYLLHFDLGYDKQNVVSLSLNMKKSDELQILRRELLKNNSIESVTADQGGLSKTIAHINNGKETSFFIKYTDESYLPLFKIPIIKGRNFSTDFPSDSTQSVIVNESFVKAAGWHDPIGQVVDFFYHNQKFKVIGVIRDYHFLSLKEKSEPQLFTLGTGHSFSTTYLRLAPGKTTAALEHLKRTVKQLYPGQPFNYIFEDETIRNNYEDESRWKSIVGFAALLTIFVSCIGLFGLSVLNAEKRAKEIGIRKVLGASVASISQKLSLDFIRLVLLAACISLPAGWWAMNKWLQNYPYRIELNLTLFAAAIISVMVIAYLTVAVQSVKAAMANPVKNLRTE